MPNSKPEEKTSALAGGVAGTKNLSRKKKLLFIAAMLVIFPPLLAVALEVLLRLVAPQPLLPRYVTDSGFGVRVHCRNISIHHSTADYRIAIRTNAMGIRADREFSFAKPDGVFRIVGLGDSFTFGYGVEVEDTYLARLERSLRQIPVRAEVINLGVSGAGTAEELIMLNEVGLRFEPDLVVVAYYRNDIGDNTRAGLYSVSDSGELHRTKDKYLPAVNMRDFLYSFGLYRYLAEHSHLMCFVREATSAIVKRRMRAENARRKSERDEERLTAALLDEIKRVCAERNIDFVVLDIPSDNYVSNLPAGFLTRVAPEEIVDLRVPFKDHVPERLLYWARSDGHWTPMGHQVAAQALLERIRHAFVPTPSATPDTDPVDS